MGKAQRRANATERKTVAERKKAAALEASPRPFRNHYAGGVMRVSACSTPQGAMIAAFKHLVYGDTTKATIVAPDDQDIARMHWTSFGVSVWAPPAHYARPQVPPADPFDKATEPKPQLRRVK